MFRSLKVSLLLTLAAAPALQAQGLRDRLSDLFTFGTCGQPLCLDLGNSHGNHFLPAATAGNTTVIGFITEALGKSASNLPISATSSGATYTIVDGLPVKTSTSAGPVFAERPQTLGKKRLFVGTNVTNIGFTSLNGVPLDNLELNFAHEDVGTPGRGDPEFENDVIRTRLALKLDLLVASVFATYGITDFIDVGVAVPMMRISMQGSSVAQIDPFGPNTPHYFGGTAVDPILRATAGVNATASGIGDVVGRVKVNLGQGRRVGAALLTEVRFPTGDEANLLGSGATSARALGVFGAQYGSFSLHGNAGYVVRTGALQNDATLATIGFDNLMTPRSTIAFSLISEWRVGDSKLALPAPIDLVFPFQRRIESTSIPERQDDRLDASLGLKINLRGGSVFLLNGTVPLRKAGVQPDFYWTSGIEISF
jgi:hypothetical protein